MPSRRATRPNSRSVLVAWLAFGQAGGVELAGELADGVLHLPVARALQAGAEVGVHGRPVFGAKPGGVLCDQHRPPLGGPAGR